MNLHDKTVLLTGASGGIGQALARGLDKAGAKLILVGRNEKTLQALIQELDSRHSYLQLDLADNRQFEELLDFCSGLPNGIDVLINNAGSGEFAWLERTDIDRITSLTHLNLVVPMVLTARLLPMLKQQEQALIINIGSVLGAIGNPGFAVYGATKAGLARFSEALRRELGDTRVHVMHFNPRATATPFNTDRICNMNKALGVMEDAPQTVADRLLQKIHNGDFSESSQGWPEKLYVKVNALFPGLVDTGFAKRLPVMKQFAIPKASQSSATSAANQPLIHHS